MQPPKGIAAAFQEAAKVATFAVIGLASTTNKILSNLRKRVVNSRKEKQQRLKPPHKDGP